MESVPIKIPGRATLSFATMKSVKNSIHSLTKFYIKRVQSFSGENALK